MYQHQHYIPSTIYIDVQKTEAMAYEQAQKGSSVMVHYHAFGDVECNDQCHEVVKTNG